MSFTSKSKTLLKKWRIIFLIAVLAFSIILIHPKPFAHGVAISGIVQNSPAYEAGMSVPDTAPSPVNREVITAINGVQITDIAQYYSIVSTFKENDSILIDTTKSSYALTLNGTLSTSNSNANNANNSNSSNNSSVSNTSISSISTTDLGIRVTAAPKSNIRMGLDLQGGTRILLEPVNKLSAADFVSLQDNVERRLNLFGLSDIRVSIINDQPVGGQPQYLLVEIAGVGIDEVQNLISHQGKFEAKIANQTSFSGSDVKAVNSDARSGAGVDTRTCAASSSGGYSCQFHFPITLSLEAAQRQANLTRSLGITTQGTQRYLDKKLDLYLDDQLVDSLFIGADLKGQAQTDIQISGGGSGASMDAAIADGAAKMKELQTVLKTGGLPSKLTIVRADTISASLGDSFINNSFLVGFLVLLAIGVVVYARYRSFKITLPMVFMSFSEILMLFGFAALAGWNIDLSAIAGIIIMLGSGIDHQIIIIDEIRAGEHKHESWVVRMKNAFTIILIAYFTSVVAMLPLLFAGAGILKGFALTTIVGISLGILVTRPAYGAVAEVLHND